MKALHTLIPLIIAPTFLLTNINQLQAGQTYYAEASQDDSFTFDRAVWRKRNDMLLLRGSGTPGANVDAFIAGTDIFLGSNTVNKRGYWSLIFYNSASVPCGVRAENGTLVLEKAVSKAPTDCISAADTPTDDPDTPADEPTQPVNTPPVISGSPSTGVAEGQAYRFAPSASDADGDSLTFAIANRPSWANFNTSTGVLSGTPDYNSAGTTSDIRISVSDGNASASLSAFSISVSNTNQVPTISGTPGTSIAEGQAYRFAPNANDADGDSLSFAIANRPSWASFNTSTGVLSGTPDYNSAGTTSDIRISVSDGNATASLSAFSISVSNTNQVPTISGTPSTRIAEGQAYRFAPSANDADGDNLSFSIANRPSWASFNTSTGVLSGTPDYNSAGTTSDIRISVSDGNASASLSAFSISVSNTNQVPTISGTPSTSVDEGQAYRFAPSANDADGDNLNFSIANRPSWASFNTSTGVLSGTPDSDSAGAYGSIVISVSDGEDSVSLGGFSITVNDVADPNNAPVISGTAESSVIAGNDYWFLPTASDADNDELTFSVSNLPSWASFNTQSGAVSGTPGTEDTGLYENIVITVSDGVDSASLSPVKITVIEPEPAIGSGSPALGSVSLVWVAPTTRTDGTSLDMSEIGGYKVYMGTTTDNLEQVIDLADSTINDHVIDNLDTGDYYFAVTIYDTDGNESSYSNVVLKSTM